MDQLLPASDVKAVAEIAENTGSPELLELLLPLFEAEAVPLLAARRFSPGGLAKRQQRLDDLQRQHPLTAGEARQLAVPYSPEDYQKSAFWSLRGPFDFPRERFIQYPQLAPEPHPGPLYGWAGWTHLQQAEVLEALYQEKRAESWTAERLLPILQGIEELRPWKRRLR